MKNVILIVDDSQSLRALVNQTLISGGYEVLQAVDGMDALNYLDGKTIDLVITDLHMPNMDGISLLKEIRKLPQYAYIPVLLLTTESQANKKMEAKEAGATGWIIKPFVQEKLLEAVKRVIKR